MDDQLHTPARLKVKAMAAEEPSTAPGGLAAIDMDGSDNRTGIKAIFGSAKQPKVQIEPEQVAKVPAAVAASLLMKNTQPVYPSMARRARVSGTIVLAASISKTGNIESLHAVSGPFMLRSSAIDAVRTWRFRPYVINNHPTAIETTINVHFSLE